MNRLYAVESTPPPTTAMADHRLQMAASEVEAFARAAIADLLAHRGRSVVVPGAAQPPVVHAIAHAMNEMLAAVGQMVIHTEPIVAPVEQGVRSLRALVDAMAADRVGVLVVLGANPVFTAPSDIDFTDALRQGPFRVHHGLTYDETSFHCDWHVPEARSRSGLISWSSRF